MKQSALIHAIDTLAPKGRHYYIQTQSLKCLQTETIEVLIEQGLPLSSPYSLIELHHFHGAASRVGESETAFALRQDHLRLEAIAAWEPQLPDDDQRHIQWAQKISQALAPYAFKLPCTHKSIADSFSKNFILQDLDFSLAILNSLDLLRI